MLVNGQNERPPSYFRNATLINSFSPETSTTLQNDRSPWRVKSSDTRLFPMRRLRMRRKSSQSGRAGLTMLSSLRAADGRMPRTDVSSKKNAPDAQAWGEHETG